MKNHNIVSRLINSKAISYCIDCDTRLSHYGPDRSEPCTGAPADVFRCNTHNSSFGWSSVIAHNAAEAAQRYYESLSPDFQSGTRIYVLEPFQNYGVDRAHEIKIKK